VSPRLTVYAGVRWSYFGQPTDTNNLLDNFDPGLYNPANAPRINPAGGGIVAGTGNNEAYPGAALAAGLHANNGNTIFTTADTPNINAVRPYLGFNAINTLETAFDSNYHSLQVSFRQEFRGAGLINAAYTYSKNLTDNASDRSNAPQNSYNWHAGEYGPATLDRSQVFTLNYVYTIPVFKDSHGALAYALKGWQVTGITTYYTGSPFTATTSGVDPAGLGILGSSSASSRPDTRQGGSGKL
jgi:hypothetical protein